MKLTIRKRNKLATSTGNSTGSRENELHQQLADAAMRELLMEEEPEKAKGKGQGALSSIDPYLWLFVFPYLWLFVFPYLRLLLV